MTCSGSIHCMRDAGCKDTECPGHPEPVRHQICDDCETVNWCANNGCIPLTPVEAALPIQFVGEEPAPARAIDWQAVWLWGAVVACFTAVIALSIYRP